MKEGEPPKTLLLLIISSLSFSKYNILTHQKITWSTLRRDSTRHERKDPPSPLWWGEIDQQNEDTVYCQINIFGNEAGARFE